MTDIETPETRRARHVERETARAKRMRKAVKGSWFLGVKGNGQDGREATLQVTLTHGLWLDLQDQMVNAYLRARENRGLTRARNEVDAKSALGWGLCFDNESVERLMALYEAACAAWGHVADGPRMGPVQLAQRGEQTEARAYEGHKAHLLQRKEDGK